jgi:predicted nucleic acid-binding protein
MICFPDVNVWVALAVAEHTHHAVAQEWLDKGEGGVVFVASRKWDCCGF